MSSGSSMSFDEKAIPAYESSYTQYISSRTNNRVTAYLQRALAVPDHYNYTDACQVEIPSSSTAKLPCAYFTMGSNLYADSPGGLPGDPYGHNDPLIMQVIAFLIDSAANQSIKFSVEDWYCNHKIQNDSNSSVQIDAYLCEWRRDVPRAPGGLATATTTPVSLLGTGFLNNGIGVSGGSANTYLTDNRSTPFQSLDFCLWANIIKTEKHTILPGQVKHFGLSHKTPFMVHPNLFINMSAGQNYNTGTPTLEYQRGAKFWLFKMSAAQLQSTGSVSGGISVGPKSLIIRMETELHWTYKYIQNAVGVVNNGVQGLTNPGTQVIMNPLVAANNNATALT